MTLKKDVLFSLEKQSCLEKEVRDLKIQINNLTDSVNHLKKELASFQAKASEYEKRNDALEIENKILKETIEELKKDKQILMDENAVESMLFSNFKERMKEKYLYDSDDEESDFEPDDDKREKCRELFRKKKQEERNRTRLLSCEKCDFLGKNTAGLKTHMRKKH